MWTAAVESPNCYDVNPEACDIARHKLRFGADYALWNVKPVLLFRLAPYYHTRSSRRRSSDPIIMLVSSNLDPGSERFYIAVDRIIELSPFAEYNGLQFLAWRRPKLTA